MKKKKCIKAELLIFYITVPLDKLDMVGTRLVSNCLIFANDIPVNTQLLTILLLSNTRELTIEAKTQKF